MLGSVALSLGTLIVRAHIGTTLGAVPLGLFGASWMISSIYLVVVMQALGTDFLPAITATLKDPAVASRLLNAQLEISLLIATPIVLFTGALAPWLLQLLYANEFAAAAPLLRWQVLGDLLKVISYPLALCVLAAGRGNTYLLVETTVVAIFVGVAFLALPRLGLEGAGVGYFLMYVVYAAILVPLVALQSGLRVSRRTTLLILIALGLTASAALGAARFGLAGSLLALVGAAAWGVWCVHRLRQLDALPGPVRRLLGEPRA